MHVLDREAPPPDRVGSYDARDTAVVDLYGASGRSLGGVILLHGGFWRAAYDRVHLRPLAVGLAAAGYDVAVPEYRRVGDAGGGVPGTVDDARRIVRVVPALLGRAPGDVSVVGHSAGGHLAMLAAGSVEEPPAQVVSLAGVLDIGAASRARLSRNAVGDLLGTPEPSAAALASIDPMLLPVPSGDVVVVHGAEDVDVPVNYSIDFAARSPAIHLAMVPEADHYDVIDPESRAFDAVLGALAKKRFT